MDKLELAREILQLKAGNNPIAFNNLSLQLAQAVIDDQKNTDIYLRLYDKYKVSKQEYKVLKGMYSLKKRQEIADSMGIEKNTVNAHAITLFKKLGVHTAVAACAVLKIERDDM